MGVSREMKVACFVVIAVVLAAPEAEAAAGITCGEVLSSVSDCLNYLRQGGAVSVPCCNGIKSLNSAAATPPDRQAVCRCTKSLAPGVGAKTEFINSLPVQCGVDFPYKYSPSMDCSKVK